MCLFKYTYVREHKTQVATRHIAAKEFWLTFDTYCSLPQGPQWSSQILLVMKFAL